MSEGASTAVVDVGGTSIKSVVLDASGRPTCEVVRRQTPYPCSPTRLVAEIHSAVHAMPASCRLAVGFPGLLRSDRVVWVNSLMRAAPGEPFDDHLSEQWVGFPLQDALWQNLGIPTRVANDADVAALSTVSGQGLECVITLGTGLGSSLVQDGVLLPHLELGGMPGRDGVDLETALGNAALETVGQQAWTAAVIDGIEALRVVLYFDWLYVGGGNSRLLTGVDLGRNVSLVDNVNGLLGGHFLWRQPPREGPG